MSRFKWGVTYATVVQETEVWVSRVISKSQPSIKFCVKPNVHDVLLNLTRANAKNASNELEEEQAEITSLSNSKSWGHIPALGFLGGKF